MPRRTRRQFRDENAKRLGHPQFVAESARPRRDLDVAQLAIGAVRARSPHLTERAPTSRAAEQARLARATRVLLGRRVGQQRRARMPRNRTGEPPGRVGLQPLAQRGKSRRQIDQSDWTTSLVRNKGTKGTCNKGTVISEEQRRTRRRVFGGGDGPLVTELR